MSAPALERVERNREALLALKGLSESAQRALLPSLRGDTLLALVECAQNVILGNVELTPSQLRWMRSQERELRALTRKKATREERVRTLLSGSGLLTGILRAVFGG